MHAVCHQVLAAAVLLQRNLFKSLWLLLRSAAAELLAVLLLLLLLLLQPV
jgi:hypothetical protein